MADLTREELAAIALESGATHYSPPPMRAVRGYSFRYEQLEQFAALLAARMQPAASSALHIYEGDCPDDTQPDSRDPLCPACQAMGGVRMQSAAAADSAQPIPMILRCPACGTQHIDAPEQESGWTNPPHRSHLCHGCGHIWRPADVPTTGVARLQTRGSADSAQPDEPVVVNSVDLADLKRNIEDHGYTPSSATVLSLIDIARRVMQPDERVAQPCPHIRGGESSQWCELAESGVRERDARIAGLVRDTVRLDWLLSRLSGKALRDAGVIYSESADKRAAIDAALAQGKGAAQDAQEGGS